MPLISRNAVLYYFKCPYFQKVDETYKKVRKYIVSTGGEKAVNRNDFLGSPDIGLTRQRY